MNPTAPTSPRLVAAVDVAESDLPSYVAALADSVVDDVVMLDRLRERRAWAADPSNPDSYAFLVDEHGPAGWLGWIAYLGPAEPAVGDLEPGDRLWETSTYLAPRLRGTGFYPSAKCWQAHAATSIAATFPGSVFISSIATTNERSIAATRRFATRNGWRTSERIVDEPWRTRAARVFTWPPPVAPHAACHLAPEPAAPVNLLAA